MTEKELCELYDKIDDVFFHYPSYHCVYVSEDTVFLEDGSLTFDVHMISDIGYGYEWTENWGIREDGSIWSEDETYKDFEDFEQRWGPVWWGE